MKHRSNSSSSASYPDMVQKPARQKSLFEVHFLIPELLAVKLSETGWKLMHLLSQFRLLIVAPVSEAGDNLVYPGILYLLQVSSKHRPKVLWGARAYAQCLE